MGFGWPFITAGFHHCHQWPCPWLAVSVHWLSDINSSSVHKTRWSFMSNREGVSEAERICFQSVVPRFPLIQERPDPPREAFAHLFRNRVSYHDFEALKRVSFVIREGETVAIVGRNGSGKSTILKIIAGVYRPTSGSVKVAGKVSALIELGAGFHPD